MARGLSQPYMEHLLNTRVINVYEHPVFTCGSFFHNSQLAERAHHKGEICTGHGAKGPAIFSANFGKEAGSVDGSIRQSMHKKPGVKKF